METTGRKGRTDESVAYGAYGLRLSGVAGAESLLVPAPAGWPPLELRVETGSPEVEERLDAESALLRLRTGGAVEIDRQRGTATFTVPAALSPDELVHPYLAPVAAVAAHWHGRESLHGGGICVGGGAFGVVGERLAGKSSLLASFAAQGHEIVADDMLVVEGATAFAGPRTIDLREDAAAALAIGESIGVAGARARWRARLGPIAPSLPLRGWLFAGWSERIELRRVPAAEALPLLLRNRGLRVPPLDPALFLQLSAMPAWELRRPRSWDAVPDVVAAVLAAVTG